MNNMIKKLKELSPRQVMNATLYFVQKHNFTALIILAGLLIGFALISVNDLASNVSSDQLITSDEPVIEVSGNINLDKTTEQQLLALKQDTGVDINSNIASYRRSAFSDVTSESEWVIRAATLLEQHHSATGTYPDDAQLISVLKTQDASFVAADPEGRTVNQPDSDYSYTSQQCSDNKCSGFMLSAKLGGSVYQLGEMDVIRRSWVNNTAQALDVFYKFEDRGYYPTETDFVTSLTEFYPSVFEEEFNAADPKEIEVNAKDGDYTYRGIDCDADGCQSFVIRTVFKDDASYFQQSQ